MYMYFRECYFDKITLMDGAAQTRAIFQTSKEREKEKSHTHMYISFTWTTAVTFTGRLLVDWKLP